jgi:hypothetical protein
MREWVQGLNRADRFDILVAIVLRGVRLTEAYRRRHTLDANLSLSSTRNVEPYVRRRHSDRAHVAYGSASGDKYMVMVGRLIREGLRFHPSRLIPPQTRRWLRTLPDVSNATRHRHKLLLSSFCQFLVDEGVLPRNVVRDVRGLGPLGIVRARRSEGAS